MTNLTRSSAMTAALVLASCVSLPPEPSPSAPAVQPVEASSGAAGTPEAAPEVVNPGGTQAPPLIVGPPALESSAVASPALIAGSGVESQPAIAPSTVIGLPAATYSDLFERLRSGFDLEDRNSRAIEQQLYWYARNPEYLERVFGRAELYLHHIVSEVEARGMPREIALLPVVESAFEPYAYSRARASGLWQFIPGTGERFGLKRNWWYDGRRDVIESTRAALDYLQFMHDEFNGDWLLAIAGYNCGEACVQRAIRKNLAQGRPIDFWSVAPRLPAETRAYVPKLLAMRRLVADPETYGIAFSPIPNEPYFTRVDTQGQVDLHLAAELAGVTFEELFELNPAFHRWATAPEGPHHLLLPIDAAVVFQENLAQLTAEERLRARSYTVKSGDTINSVARQFGTQPTVVRELNGLSSDTLTAGSVIVVPSNVMQLPPKVMRAAAIADGRGARPSGQRPVIHVVKRGDSLWRIAKRHRMDVNTLASLNGMQPGDTLRAGQKLRLRKASSGADVSSGAGASGSRKVTYTVRRGDTLSRIARMFQVSVSQIVSWNGISAKTILRPGQKLSIRVARKT
jgi:membrane-bound lytic murein transglycosylase D